VWIARRVLSTLGLAAKPATTDSPPNARAENDETTDDFDGAEHLAGAIARVLEDGAVAVLATLVEVRPPHPAGAKLLIDDSAKRRRAARATMRSTNQSRAAPTPSSNRAPKHKLSKLKSSRRNS
jgi:hypothetical protein